MAGDEYAIGRPCVVRDPDRYRMWFSARGDTYRLGYAESADGFSWTRRDSAIRVEPAPEAWEADMLAYPTIVNVCGRRYLLYNGNGYGQTGIGYAVAA